MAAGRLIDWRQESTAGTRASSPIEISRQGSKPFEKTPEGGMSTMD